MYAAPIVRRYEHPTLLTIMNMFKLVHFQNRKCDCIKNLKLGDPTCGSGGILISCIDHIKSRGQEWRNVKVYGQEIIPPTASICRMNLFLHGVKEFTIRTGDTLSTPAFLTLNQEDYVIADSITHWGRSCKCHIDKSLCMVPAGPAHNFTYERLGLNVEMSELNACFGRWQLQNINQIETARKRNYDSLYEALKDVPSLKVWPIPDVNCSPFVFPIRLKNGMTVREAYSVLSDKGIEIRTLMGGAISEQEAFHNMLAGSEVPVAQEMAETTFFVGVHNTLPNEDVETVGAL